VINAGIYIIPKLADCEPCNAMDGHLEKLMVAQIISRFPNFHWSQPLAALMPQFNHMCCSLNCVVYLVLFIDAS
jgi:hypothetical protein